MKTFKKSLALLLSILMVFSMAAIGVSVSAVTAGDNLYLVPNSNWTQASARFAAYFFGAGEKWVSMTAVEGEDNLYEVTIPDGGYTSVIFCRMNPSNT